MTGPDRSSTAAVVDGIDVDALAAAVRACPAVAGLSGGEFGTAGTYLPGRRVPGVSVSSTPGGPVEVIVRVVARSGATMSEVDGQIRRVTAVLAPGSPVSVAIDDVALDGKALDDLALDDIALDDLALDDMDLEGVASTQAVTHR